MLHNYRNFKIDKSNNGIMITCIKSQFMLAWDRFYNEQKNGVDYKAH